MSSDATTVRPSAEVQSLIEQVREEMEERELQSYSPDEIMDIVREARRLCVTDPRASANERLEVMRGRHRDFWLQYPALLDKSCQPEPMDMAQMRFLVERLRSMQHGKETLESAGLKVQQRLDKVQQRLERQTAAPSSA